MSESRMPRIVETVVAQHAEEAAFLWLLRNQASRAPHYELAELAELDERVEAHLDGLRIAGQPGWELAVDELAWEEPGELFVVASLAIESEDAARWQRVLDAVASAPALFDGLVSALAFSEHTRVPALVRELHASEEAWQRHAGITAAALRREDPGPALSAALAAEGGRHRARALRAAGELGRADLAGACLEQVEDKDACCRFWAAWSATLLGSERALGVLERIAENEERYAEEAAELAALRMPLDEASAWRAALAATPGRERVALTVAGAAGDPAALPWLLECCSDDTLAQAAGQAWTRITGVRLDDEDLDRDRPEAASAGPSESPEDEEVALDPNEDLPCPDGAALERWWREHGAALPAGERHLLGQPVSRDGLENALVKGYQRERAHAALALALLAPDAPVFEVRARGSAQRRILGV